MDGGTWLPSHCHMSCPCPSWNSWNVTLGLPSLVSSSVLVRATWNWTFHLSSSTHRHSLPALLWSLLPHHKRTNISLCKANYLLLFILSGSHNGRGSVTQPSYSSLTRLAQLLPPILILILILTTDSQERHRQLPAMGLAAGICRMGA